MSPKLKRGAPVEEPSGSCSKRRGRIGVEGPSKISGLKKVGAVAGPSKKVNGEAGFEKMEEVPDRIVDQEGVNVHPLLNSLVLETVFKYTKTLEDVKRNRLVCKTWMNAAEPRWTTLTKTLTLYRNVLELSQVEMDDEAQMTLRQLREMCDGTRSTLEKVIPYRKFKFQSWTFDPELLQAIKPFTAKLITVDRWFWNRIAPSVIKTLTLEGCQFLIRFVPFEERFLRRLPNLQSLNVINCATTNAIVYSAVEAWRRQQFRQDEGDQRADLGYLHQNLKYVKYDVSSQQNQTLQPASLFPMFGWVPNLEGFWIGGIRSDVEEDIVLGAFVARLINASVNRTLKTLHLLDFSTRTYEGGALDYYGNHRVHNVLRFENLEEFYYDVGYGREAELEMMFILDNMPALKKLNLYRAPLSQPLANFLEGERMEILTELHFWGNLSISLEFLNALPNLQVLKWMTSCYEEKFHGQRVTSALEENGHLKTYPLMLRDLISTSEEVNTLEYLSTLEMDWGPISTKSWKRLGEWMPNLKNLKAIVSRAEHLGIMRDQWKLETLEFGHGSKLPGGKLLKELVKFGGSLKKFQWKGCACTKKLFGKRVASGLQETVKKFGSQLPEKCTFPWNVNLEGEEANVCKHAAFEETLMSKAVSAKEWST